METIGDRIRMLRKEKGLTHVQLAEEIECHENNISHWENNRCLPNALMVIVLSETFGVSTDYILKGGKR